MSTKRKYAALLWSLGALAAAAALLAPDAMGHLLAHALPGSWSHWLAMHALHVGGVSLAQYGPMLGLGKGKSKADLTKLTQPETATEPEYYPDVLWDTFPYVSGTTSGAINFFGATQADKTLSNLLVQGSIPDKEWFEIGEIHFDMLERPTLDAAADATGEYDDNVNFRLASRATIALTLRNKTYGPVPLAMVRPLGGGRAAGYGAPNAATNAVQIGTFWDAIGWVFEKSQVIGPLQNFSVTIQLPAPVTLKAGNTNIRVALRGVHYRPPA